MTNQNGADNYKMQGLASLPKHVAIIMDGNGRWAQERHLPRVEGHRNGAKSVRKIVEESRRLGIRYLTVFAFSTENWGRPGEEVSALMKLFLHYLENEVELLLKHDIRLRSIGDISKLPQAVQDSLLRCEERTLNCKSMDFVIAISYGARDEIINAAKSLAIKVKNGELDASTINEQLFSAHMYAPDIPDPELLIRTSAEYRISNFLLWQLAYTEIVISTKYWPDFNVDEYHACLKEFTGRKRRFGLTEEQIRADKAGSELSNA